jgi:hypothetical protein
MTAVYWGATKSGPLLRQIQSFPRRSKTIRTTTMSPTIPLGPYPQLLLCPHVGNTPTKARMRMIRRMVPIPICGSLIIDPECDRGTTLRTGRFIVRSVAYIIRRPIVAVKKLCRLPNRLLFVTIPSWGLPLPIALVGVRLQRNGKRARYREALWKVE